MIKLSVSSIDTFKNCAKKYYYRYIEKVKVDSTKWNFTEFGSCAHRILELFHIKVNHETPQEEWPSIMKECFVESVKEFDYTVLNEQVWSPDGNKVGLAYLREMMQDYLELMREQGLPNVIHNELAYELELTEGAIIRGYIDRIDKLEDGVYKVVDYKTSKNPKYLKDFQLLVYANAIKQIYPDAEKVVGSFMLLKHNFKEVEYEFTDFDLENCMDEVMKNLELIQVEKNWAKNPTRLCDWCDYKDMCFGKWTEE
jgi:putative RecB family exonuclease